MWTKDEVTTALRDAHEAVAAADVPPHLQAPAFASALQALLARPMPAGPPVGFDLTKLRGNG